MESQYAEQPAMSFATRQLAQPQRFLPAETGIDRDEAEESTKGNI